MCVEEGVPRWPHAPSRKQEDTCCPAKEQPLNVFVLFYSKLNKPKKKIDYHQKHVEMDGDSLEKNLSMREA